MRCFHCKAQTELVIRGRPICASAECHHVARQGPGLAKAETKNVDEALAEPDRKTKVVYG